MGLVLFFFCCYFVFFFSFCLILFLVYLCPLPRSTSLSYDYLIGEWPNDIDFVLLWILQSDAYQATGCYNLLCSGFIQISNQIAMGASIFPISNYGGSQYDINILVWKVNSKKLSHAEHTTNQIHEWDRRESVVPTCLLFFLKASSQGYNCGSSPVCGRTRRVTVGPTHGPDLSANDATTDNDCHF